MDEPQITQATDEETFSRVLFEATRALEDADLEYVCIGGIPSIAYGRPHATKDIDFLVRPHQAERALEALEQAGFETHIQDPRWLCKASRDGVLVDVIFRVKREIYLDDEMVERSRIVEYTGAKVRVCSPEDGLVIEALSHDDGRPAHWYNALAILANREPDWEYLRRRARHGARRVLSLLIYAHSNDLMVPEEAIRGLYEDVYGKEG